MRNLRNLVVGFSLGIVATATMANPVAASVMCGRKDATGHIAQGASLKLRDACKANELAVDPVALNLQGPPGTPGAQGPPGPEGPPGVPGSGLVVRDANGVLVGVVQDPYAGGTANVVRYVGVQGIEFTVDQFIARGTQYPEYTYLFYQSMNCSGPAFMSADGGGFYAPTGKYGLVIYYPSAPVSSTNFLSIELKGPGSGYSTPASCSPPGTFTPPDTCCLPASGSVFAGPAEQLDLSGFVPPFDVVAQ
jgi:hypothetical protein